MSTHSPDSNRTNPKRGTLLSVPGLILAVAVVLSISAFLFYRSSQDEIPVLPASDSARSGAEPSGIVEREQGNREAIAGSTAVDPTEAFAHGSDDIAAIELAFERARERHDVAVAQVARAQAALDESERAVDDLERFIEDLKARGEDPADHAEEGMARFRPAFDAYEKAMGQLERAEALEALALEERQSAEQRWLATRRLVRSEP
jgi:hypothetical protein